MIESKVLYRLKFLKLSKETHTWSGRYVHSFSIYFNALSVIFLRYDHSCISLPIAIKWVIVHTIETLFSTVVVSSKFYSYDTELQFLSVAHPIAHYCRLATKNYFFFVYKHRDYLFQILVQFSLHICITVLKTFSSLSLRHAYFQRRYTHFQAVSFKGTLEQLTAFREKLARNK